MSEDLLEQFEDQTTAVKPVEESPTHSIQMLEDENDYHQLVTDLGNKPCVLMFSAKWCGPCKVVWPDVMAASTKYTGVKFAKVDVNGDLDTVVELYGVKSIPVFECLNNGEIDKEIVGANVVELLSWLELVDPQ
jgi:thioredoxin 1